MGNRTANNKRIAKNTIALYIRMFFTMLVGFYATRVVLNVLGEDDYGIYNVVGGFVSLLAFLNGAMSIATSRFITFELGKSDETSLKRTFAAALNLHIIIAIIIVILAETIGLWFVNAKLTIPENRMFAANVVYQLSVLSVIFTVTQIPYNACIIAHEKMNIYAYVEILNSILRLLIIYILYIGNFDKLILYAVLCCLVSILILWIYRFYCIKKFTECHFKLEWNKAIINPMLKFSGWELYGNMSALAKTQGINILLNIFFGPAMNAASGVSATISSSVNRFVANVGTAMNPQIVKNYASNDIKCMESLMCNSIKFMYILFSLAAIPLLLELNFVMTLWLKNVPDYAVIFCKIVLLEQWLCIINTTLSTGIQATGFMGRISYINGTLTWLNLPIMYIFLRLGYKPYSVFICSLIINCITVLCCLFILKKQIRDISIRNLIRFGVFPAASVAVFSCIIPFIIRCNMQETWVRFILVLISASLSIGIFTYFLALNKELRHKALYKLRNKWGKKTLR